MRKKVYKKSVLPIVVAVIPRPEAPLWREITIVSRSAFTVVGFTYFWFQSAWLCQSRIKSAFVLSAFGSFLLYHLRCRFREESYLLVFVGDRALAPSKRYSRIGRRAWRMLKHQWWPSLLVCFTGKWLQSKTWRFIKRRNETLDNTQTPDRNNGAKHTTVLQC